MKSLILAGVCALTLAACGAANDAATKASDMAGDAANKASDMAKDGTAAAMDKAEMTANGLKLDAILLAQDDKIKARYDARNPKETLMFFGIKPGMTVAEALPGGGWYSKILIPYLGNGGALIGMDYDINMWSEFGGRLSSEDFINGKKTWPETWVEGAQEWRAGSDGTIKATTFGADLSAHAGTVDAVLFIRALHNMNRFSGGETDWMGGAMSDTMTLLKPGGIVGVVQHQGPEGNDDDWANGSNGYLKKSAVIKRMTDAGFEFVAESDINENPKDVPSNEDGVWRLPPTLAGTKDNPELRTEREAIGETNRMTLLFRKPA